MNRQDNELERGRGRALSSNVRSLIFLSSIFFLNFASRIIFSPLLPSIHDELSLDHTQSGSIFLFISSGYCLSVLLSGLVSSRLGHRFTIIVSTALSGLALLLVSRCTDLLSLRIALCILGYCAGLYLPSGIYTITRLVAPAYLARGIAIHEVAPNLAFVLAPLAGTFILGHGGWRIGVSMAGVLLLAIAALYWYSQEGSDDRGMNFDFSVVRQFFVLPRFWMITLMFSAAICSTVGIYAMLPLFLVSDRGLPGDVVNSLVALSRVSTIFMPLVAGWLGDKFGNRMVMIGVLLLTGILTVPVGIVQGLPLMCIIFIQPMVAVCFFPSAFAMLSKFRVGEGQSNPVSLAVPIAFLTGGGLLPTLIGMLGDLFSLATGFIASGVLMIGSAMLALVCMKPVSDRKKIVP